MKQPLYLMAAFIVATLFANTATSCKFAPSQDDGDTVAASIFYPEETVVCDTGKTTKDSITSENAVDSVGMYYVGSGSTKELIQLVSYPSKRDTFIYSKTRHVKVKGCADINHVVKVDYYLLNGTDSLVKYVEEVLTNGDL